MRGDAFEVFAAAFEGLKLADSYAEGSPPNNQMRDFVLAGTKQTFYASDFGKTAVETYGRDGVINLPLFASRRDLLREVPKLVKLLQEGTMELDAQGVLQIKPSLARTLPQIKSQKRYLYQVKRLGEEFEHLVTEMAERVAAGVRLLVEGALVGVNIAALVLLLNGFPLSDQVGFCCRGLGREAPCVGCVSL